MTEDELKPIIEALIYVAEEPISQDTLVELLGKDHKESIRNLVQQLVEQYQCRDHGIEIKEVAGGLKMATKPEHHEWVAKLIKHQTPPIKLSLAALETLAVIAYKQPATLPEIQEVRGVNAGAVLKTLIEKKLVTTAGRKSVIGRPILYKTTREFLIHFGLKDLHDLPSLEEFEELAEAIIGEEAILAGRVKEPGKSDELETDNSAKHAIQTTEDLGFEPAPERSASEFERSPEGEATDAFPTVSSQTSDGLGSESTTTVPNLDTERLSAESAGSGSSSIPSPGVVKD